MKVTCLQCHKRFQSRPYEPDDEPDGLCQECSDENEAYAIHMTTSYCIQCKGSVGWECICESDEKEPVLHPVCAEDITSWAPRDAQVDHVYRSYAGAPGVGYIDYEVVQIREGRVIAEIIRNTIRELSPEECY